MEVEVEVDFECEHCGKITTTTVAVDVEPTFDMHELD